MLGEPGHKGLMVSQAAWIRSLLATTIKSWEGKGRRIGGLFGAPVGASKQTPSWNKMEQVALLIFVGKKLGDAIRNTNAAWAKSLRQQNPPAGFPFKLDLAFYGPDSLLNQDQGIRAFLYVLNDFLYINADKLGLISWGGSEVDGTDVEAIDSALKSLGKNKELSIFATQLTEILATYDWRASDAPGLNENESLLKAAFRGSGGYRELRQHLLKHISAGQGQIAETAKQTVKILA